jgi:hypothetical protein
MVRKRPVRLEGLMAAERRSYTKAVREAVVAEVPALGMSEERERRDMLHPGYRGADAHVHRRRLAGPDEGDESCQPP